jgi:hypothetical protein
MVQGRRHAQPELQSQVIRSSDCTQGGCPMKLASSWTWAARAAVAAVALVAAFDAVAADGTATGTLFYKSKDSPITVALKYVWLVKGPDSFNPKIIIRRLIFSATDVGATIAACKTMTCTEAGLGSGMTLDLNPGPRLNYWVSLNDQHVQYSGTAAPRALRLATDTPSRLAGTLFIDNTDAGGAKVEVEFDAPLLQEMELAR